MKKLFTLLVITLLSITAFGQDIFDEPSAIGRVNPKNFNSMLDNHYGFISNGNYYLLAYPLEWKNDVSGRISYISRDLNLYLWKNDTWCLASNDIVSTDYRKIDGDNSYHDGVAKKDYYKDKKDSSNYSKIQAFGDTIVMFITHQYGVEYFSFPPKFPDEYLYNTINIFIPIGNGKYDIINYVPEVKKTETPIWHLEKGVDIIKSGNKLILKLESGDLHINIWKR